jgi:hypothetical protein
MMSGVFGKVTAISGTTITITGGKNDTSYSVDASNATVEKASATKGAEPVSSSVSDIAIGDTIAVRGTLSGTSIVATNIMDGAFMRGKGGPVMQGRGNHGVSGVVSAVNGDTLTITGKDGKTYSVTTSGAGVTKISTITASDITVGDTLQIQGAVSGTNVTAAHITDGILTHGANAPPQH